MRPTRFVILVGMLGSGKTSLLEELLKSGVADSTAIIVNEAGAINIDGAVLSESARGVSMATLSNGCVCCSLSNDLTTTVEDLFAERARSGQAPFERIVLECSGLARPGAVMLSLRQLSRLGLNVHIVATYDCVRSPLTSETFKNAVSQLGAAHVIVLTKVDLASETQRLLARNAVMEVNPHARVVNHPALAHRARAAFLESVPTSGHVSAPLSDSNVPDGLLHPRIRVFSATFGEMPVWDQTIDWLEDVAGATGDRLLRAKAIVPGPYGHDRVLIQSVGTTFSPPRRLVNPALGAEASAVFIVRDCRLFEMEATGSNLGITWTQLPHAGATMWFGDHLREKDDAF